MPTLLDQALHELEQLPADAQEAIVHDLLELIRSESKWDKSFADPRSRALLSRLAAEADAEVAPGDVYDFDPATRAVQDGRVRGGNA